MTESHDSRLKPSHVPKGWKGSRQVAVAGEGTKSPKHVSGAKLYALFGRFEQGKALAKRAPSYELWM